MISIGENHFRCNWRIAMGHISTTKGLNLPFKNKADDTKIIEIPIKMVCIDLSAFTYLHLKLLKETGDTILKGEPLAKDIHNQDRLYLSGVSGKIIEIQRGERRRITAVIIEMEPLLPATPELINTNLAKEQIMPQLLKKGFSFYIHKRPFHRVINKEDLPRSIFINTVTSAPYTPSYKHIYKENKALFTAGVKFLERIAPIHLIYNEQAFLNPLPVTFHKATGPHPIQSPSIHISAFDPITAIDDVVWSLDVYDILSIGSLSLYGVPFSEKIIALAGEGFSQKERKLVKTTKGASILELIGDKKNYISGDPLTGMTGRSYLREKDTVITSFISEKQDEILPFLKLGTDKSTITRAYIGGFFKKRASFAPPYKLGGEERPFIAKDIYQPYFPLHIYIEPLIKALLAKDYSLAISLGFLEMDTDDLSICEYICPSKISLMAIFSEAKEEYLELYMN
ncbi:MAG: Na(+)-translocating NADH-quinone reductase subunit A [Chlamydiia bacterium]|nr:Na(+)-translocating NADH-quinone reductase subunit A [Chlamydiia bacterium]MCH9618300.1 Na(+)-translocating NADH-quinone reductase subunit A [Chlamydiia bacterium]MCH9624173.1 Na(+)-translocating NADH-quinone reductase subunit A [Chlamydiia bacterium]